VTSPDLTVAQRDAADGLWKAYQNGTPIPAERFTGLGFEDGLIIQANIFRRRLARGDHHVGWKVGLTSERARSMVGIDDRPFGHLMRLVDNGATLEAAEVNKATVEPEMCFTIGEAISGDHVDPASVPQRIKSVAAGYELNERRAIVGGDLAMLVADNLTNWAIVEGSGVSPDNVADIDATEVVMSCNGEERFRCISRDEVDNPYLSISRLAATLHRHGMSLEPGQKVITGAYVRYQVEPGQTWTADYSGIGRVEVSYR